MIVKTVGRGSDNDIIINDLSVSRVHLQLVQDDNGDVSVVDLASTNGTYVNGNRIISETKLNPGDTLRIGDKSLPWQTYFPQEQSPTPHHTPKHKKILWFVGIGALLILIIVGGVLIYRNSKIETEKERREQDSKDELLNIKDQDYMILREKKRKTELEALAEKNKRAEEAKQHAVESQHVLNNKIVADNKASVAQVERENEHNALIRACLENDTMKQMVEEANKKAEEISKIAQEATEIANEQAEKAKLTEEFYQELRKAGKKKLKKVCTVLGIQDAKNNNDRYIKIEAKFNSATDNAARRKIIDIMRNTQ